MEKQMELFEDGGLKDEGGMVDEQSGNDVPVGSSRKEVRDDIPAMLSEGEFVFPADVVRYHGLDKLMDLRQQAKMGLKQMDAMGQMGNSEEATVPDDMPFGPSDLIIVGGEMEDGPREMAEGGVVYANQGTFATGIGGYQPSIYQGQQTSSTYAPPPSSVAPPAPAPSPAGGYMPKFVANQTTPFNDGSLPVNTGSTTATNTASDTSGVSTASTEDKFVPTVEDKYTSLTYINKETNEKRDFYFYNGSPVTPIPDGFVPFDETVDETGDDLESTIVESTQVRSDNDSDSYPTETPEPIDYSSLSAADLKKAYAQNQTASAVMAGLTAVNPIFGLVGSWATRSTRKNIEDAMKDKGIKIPESTGIKGIFDNIIGTVKDLLNLDDDQEKAVKSIVSDGGNSAPTEPYVAPTPKVSGAQGAVNAGYGTSGGGEFGMSTSAAQGAVNAGYGTSQGGEFGGMGTPSTSSTSNSTPSYGGVGSSVAAGGSSSTKDNSPPKKTSTGNVSTNTPAKTSGVGSREAAENSSTKSSRESIEKSSTTATGTGSNAKSGGLDGLGYINRGGLMDKNKLVTKTKPNKNRGIAARKKKK